jgi:hypothetical protein
MPTLPPFTARNLTIGPGPPRLIQEKDPFRIKSGADFAFQGFVILNRRRRRLKCGCEGDDQVWVAGGFKGGKTPIFQLLANFLPFVYPINERSFVRFSFLGQRYGALICGPLRPTLFALLAKAIIRNKPSGLDCAIMSRPGPYEFPDLDQVSSPL